jgi:hypothetical protein
MKQYKFKQAGKKTLKEDVAVKMKDAHTIVAKWPYKLQLNATEDLIGARAEFEALRASGLRGDERYVEWKRAD